MTSSAQLTLADAAPTKVAVMAEAARWMAVCSSMSAQQPIRTRLAGTTAGKFNIKSSKDSKDRNVTVG